MAETLPDQDEAPNSALKDAEIESARAVFRDLDKAWRATRTYGIENTVTRRFKTYGIAPPAYYRKVSAAIHAR